jgi:hypothetical protein
MSRNHLELAVLAYEDNRTALDQAIKKAGGIGVETLIDRPLKEVLACLAANHVGLRATYAPPDVCETLRPSVTS